jgi:hypothetical protein
MADFDIILERTGAAPPKVLKISANNSAKEVLILRRKGGASNKGDGTFTVETSTVLKITPVEGSLDAQGQAKITVGPSGVGMKGDATLTFKVGSNQRDTQSVRFV